MLSVYHSLTKASGPALRLLLRSRLRRGKEDPLRLQERMGRASLPRPPGKLVWFHAASVGEAQSTLILVEALLARCPGLNILVTTGTVTSAALMGRRLPPQAMHQYYPLDHPQWAAAFLDHWKPDLVLWMESELWPNMLAAIRERKISSALINARMSPRAYRRWKKIKPQIARLLTTFELFLAQTQADAESFEKLGAIHVEVRDNLKYAAAPLPWDQLDLTRLKAALAGRPLWLYASTHDGEEQIACETHKALKQKIPDLLTVIAPRHPERRESILALCQSQGLTAKLRGESKTLPAADDDIYIADTMGELGLFYRLSPIACIGRSFSLDGGGGHNPIEAAQLGCAVLHGPRVQNLGQIFAEMDKTGAALNLEMPEGLAATIARLLADPAALKALQDKALFFAQAKAAILQTVLKDLAPLLVDAEIVTEEQLCA